MHVYPRSLGIVLRIGTGFAGILAFFCVFWGAFTRYVLATPAGWTEETARYAMIYGVMFGAALAWLDRTEIRFAMLEKLVPPSARVVLFRALDLGMVLFGITFAVSGWLFAMKRGDMMSISLGIPMFWPQLAIPLGGVMFALAGAAALFLPAGFEQSDELPHAE